MEWRIYLVFPLLVYLWRLLGPWITTLLSVAASIGLLFGLRAVHAHYPAVNASSWGICPHYLALFTFGMLAGDLALSKRRLALWRNSLPWGTLVLAMLAGVAVLSGFAGSAQLVPWQALDFLIGLGALCLLVLAARRGRRLRDEWVGRVLSWPPLVFIGTFAYSIYLLHAPLLQVIWQYGLVPRHLSPALTFLELTFLGTPAILAVSYGFFWCCERPFLTSRQTLPTSPAALDAVWPPTPSPEQSLLHPHDSARSAPAWQR